MDLFNLFEQTNSEDNHTENTNSQTENESQPIVNLFGEQPVPIVPKDQAPTTDKPVESTPKEEEAPVVPVKNEEKKKKSKGKTTSKLADKLKEQKEKQENMTITPEWTIAYAAQQYHTPHEMKLEEVREWLEVDFPELSKERTTWDIDESKHLLVPIVSGAKKG